MSDNPTSSSPDREPRTEAEARLVADRVDTEHLSVESIIETYADRLANAYPKDRPELIDESRDLLDWWTARGEPAIEFEAAHEARTAALREVREAFNDWMVTPGLGPLDSSDMEFIDRMRAAIRDLEQEAPGV